jgi:ribonuclease BN (tRNA processing enzyme)
LPHERQISRTHRLRWIGAAALLLATALAPAGAAPPEAGALRASQSTRIITLGTLGGPQTRAQRAEPASVLQVGDRAYLIDAGDGVAHQLAIAGFKPADIRTIFLTHLHFDHVAGLAPLIGFAWVSMRSKGIDVYGPPGTSDFLAASKQYLTIPANIYAKQMPPMPSIADLTKAHEFDVVKPTVVYSDDKVRVTAVENSHFDTIPGNQRPPGAKRSYSYRFDTPDRSAVFTGDTGPSAAVAALAKGADVLVSEVIDVERVMSPIRNLPGVTEENIKSMADHMYHEHLSAEEVGRLATQAGVKMIILNHIAPSDDGDTDMRHYTDGVRKTFSGLVVVSHDGGEY